MRTVVVVARTRNSLDLVRPTRGRLSHVAHLAFVGGIWAALRSKYPLDEATISAHVVHANRRPIRSTEAGLGKGEILTNNSPHVGPTDVDRARVHVVGAPSVNRTHGPRGGACARSATLTRVCGVDVARVEPSATDEAPSITNRRADSRVCAGAAVSADVIRARIPVIVARATRSNRRPRRSVLSKRALQTTVGGIQLSFRDELALDATAGKTRTLSTRSTIAVDALGEIALLTSPRVACIALTHRLVTRASARARGPIAGIVSVAFLAAVGGVSLACGNFDSAVEETTRLADAVSTKARDSAFGLVIQRRPGIWGRDHITTLTGILGIEATVGKRSTIDGAPVSTRAARTKPARSARSSVVKGKVKARPATPACIAGTGVVVVSARRANGLNDSIDNTPFQVDLTGVASSALGVDVFRYADAVDAALFGTTPFAETTVAEEQRYTHHRARNERNAAPHHDAAFWRKGRLHWVADLLDAPARRQRGSNTDRQLLVVWWRSQRERPTFAC